MRRGVAFLAVLVSALMLTGFATGMVAPPEVTSQPIEPHGGSSAKTVVLELFTGTWCGPCAYTDPPISRMIDEYDPSDLLVVAYHLGPDPYTNSASQTRDLFYDIQFVPTIIVDGGGPYNDGTLWQIGATPSRATNYNTYRGLVDGRYSEGSSLTISLSGDLTRSTAVVTAAITSTDPPLSNLTTRFVLYEDSLYYMGSNNEPYHRSVVRDLQEQPLSIAVGETVTQTATFTLNPTWQKNKLGAAVFVQTNDRTQITIVVSGAPRTFWKAEILQGAKVDFVPAGVLLQRDTGPSSDYDGVYERLLSDRGEHFRTWNSLTASDTGSTDDLGMPTSTDLAQSPGLVWYTGAVSAGVLTAEERTALGAHLDGPGSMLITGSNIGFDTWLSDQSWYRQYLHASFEGDDTGLGSVTGVVGDPISNGYAGIPLPVLTSPDRVNLASSGPDDGIPFVYQGNLPASVRAGHDADSRVVYLGFEYFETADPMRGDVLGDILSWLDGASAPAASVIQPNGGEQWLPGTQYDIRWTASDVRLPSDAIDIYFTTNYGPSPTWELIATGEPNDGLFRWTFPDRNSANCRVRIVAQDASPNSPDGEAVSAGDFICGDPYFRINFGPGDVGWRLISFPVVLSDTAVDAVMSSIAGNYRVARAYVASDAGDPWKTYVPAKADGDLANIDHKMAFWVEITAPGTFEVLGTRPALPTSIALKAGWNLVGFPSSSTGYTVADLKSATGATRVEGFDATATPYFLQVLPDTYVLRAGEGYWVYVPTDAAWLVPV